MTRWRQFSLRTFLLAVTLLGIALAWIAAKRAEAAWELAAARALSERSVGFIDRWELAPRTVVTKWLLGDNSAAVHTDAFFDRVNSLDDDLALLQDMPNLDSVTLGENISDQGLAHLRGHPGISSISIIESKITDAGLSHLRTLPRLNYLNLWGNRMSGAGFEHLAGVKLTYLRIRRSPLEDRHQRHLQLLPVLETLDLGETPITDGGLVYLQANKSLRVVNVTRCPVTEAGVDALLAANPDLIVLDNHRPRGTRVKAYEANE